jgi:hypothetical protein
MHNKFITLLFLFSWSSQAQDTLTITRDYYGGKTIVMRTAKDTLQKTFYPSGKLASVLPFHRLNKTVVYERYSTSGKLSYQMELKNDQPHGDAYFYDSKGKLWASLNFDSGVLVDTTFVRKRNTLVLGKVNFRSVVHGGAIYEDGRSNIQETKGVIQHMKFTIYPNDETTETASLIGIQSYADDFGFIVFQLRKNNKSYTLIPNNELPKSIQKGQVLSDPNEEINHHSAWSVTPATGVHSKEAFLFLELWSVSVGFAP